MPKVTPKKKCCKDKKPCENCPLVLVRLVKMGYAEKDGRSGYRIAAKVPKKALLLARNR